MAPRAEERVIGFGFPLAILQATQIAVGADRAFTTIGAALADAAPGDTVLVAPGVYRERPVIDRTVVLLGEPGAIVDGGGAGTVLTVRAAGTVVRGFGIRGSGADQSREDSGIMVVRADDVVIAENRLEDVLFGIYLKECDRAEIHGNDIEGKDRAIPLRGDGIRLWYSHGGRISHNQLRRVRDLVIWFSDSTVVLDNRVEASRYGLHFMYSNHNRFERNAFVANDVGAFIMYSTDVVFRANVFAEARGTTGRGLGFKDADRITAERNVLVKNAIGITIDNSPHSEGVTNEFRDNVVAYNDVAVNILPSVHSNLFAGNRFLHNVLPLTVSGGGTALANTWRNNYWSDYAGFDAAGDGRGDTPYVVERLSDDLFAKHRELQIFALSPAAGALNTLSRVLPLLAPRPMLVDSAPRVEPALDTTPAPPHRVAAVAFVAVALLAAAPVAFMARRPRRQR